MRGRANRTGLCLTKGKRESPGRIVRPLRIKCVAACICVAAVACEHGICAGCRNLNRIHLDDGTGAVTWVGTADQFSRCLAVKPDFRAESAAFGDHSKVDLVILGCAEGVAITLCRQGDVASLCLPEKKCRARAWVVRPLRVYLVTARVRVAAVANKHGVCNGYRKCDRIHLNGGTAAVTGTGRTNQRSC